MNDVKITALRAAEGGARLVVEVVFEQGGEVTRETLCVMAARLKSTPRLGTISKETLSELRREAALCEAIAAGLRALGAAASSKRHLFEKLRARGFDSEVAREAVEELAAKGYLKEEEGALREAERGLAKLWGDRRILQDLCAKGYSGSALQYARARLRCEDGAKRCCALMEKRRMTPSSDAREMQRMCASLSRYGYTVEEIRGVLKGMKK